MTDSVLETDEEIEELADIYSSSSYFPSTEDSDSDTSYQNTSRNNSIRHKRSSSQKIDKSTPPDSSIPVEDISRNNSIRHKRPSSQKIDESTSDSNIPVEDLIRRYLAEVEEIRGSSDVENQFIKLCKTFLTNHLQITPEQRKKVKMLDIEIDDCNFDDSSTENKSSQKFSKQELLEIIEENWNSFCEDYGFHPKNDLKLFVFGKGIKDFVPARQKKKFKLYLSLHFPYHSLSVVHLTFLEFAHSSRNYENFTTEEDELLLIWYEVEGRTSRYFRCSVLPLILQRSSKILELRRNFLVINPDPLAEFSMIRDFYMRKKGKMRMIDILNIRKHGYVKQKKVDAKIVPEYMEDILNRQDNEYPDWIMDEQAWEKIAEIDGQSSVKEVKKTYFQELYPSVRASEKVRSTEFKRRLIQQIGLLEQPTWETVDWKELGKNCFNVGAVRVYSVIRTLVKKHVPPEKWDALDVAFTIISAHYKGEKDLSTTWDGECSKREKIDAKIVPEYMEDILNRQDNEYPDWIMDEQAWEKIVEIDGQSSVKEVKKTYFQELYPSVRASEKVRSSQFKRRLIEQISLLEQPTWETVDWKELGKNCFNVGAVRVYSVIRTLVQKHVPPEKWDALDAALTSLRKYYRLPPVSLESDVRDAVDMDVRPLSNKNVKYIRSGHWKRTYRSKLEESLDDNDADTEESSDPSKKEKRGQNVRRKLSSELSSQGFTDFLDSLLNISGC